MVKKATTKVKKSTGPKAKKKIATATRPPKKAPRKNKIIPKKKAKKPGPKVKRGPPEFKATPKVLKKIEKLASQGLCDYQIAYCIGINKDTMVELKKRDPEISVSLERGKAAGVEFATGALKAKVKKGDMFAIKYFLNNVAKQEWQEKPEIDLHLNNHIQLVVDKEDLNA